MEHDCVKTFSHIWLKFVVYVAFTTSIFVLLVVILKLNIISGKEATVTAFVLLSLLIILVIFGRVYFHKKLRCPRCNGKLLNFLGHDSELYYVILNGKCPHCGCILLKKGRKTVR